jgi:hypothetical protein
VKPKLDMNLIAKGLRTAGARRRAPGSRCRLPARIVDALDLPEIVPPRSALHRAGATPRDTERRLGSRKIEHPPRGLGRVSAPCGKLRLLAHVGGVAQRLVSVSLSALLASASPAAEPPLRCACAPRPPCQLCRASSAMRGA